MFDGELLVPVLNRVLRSFLVPLLPVGSSETQLLVIVFSALVLLGRISGVTEY